MNGSNLMLEFESLGELYFRPGANEGPSIRAKYRCYYSIVNWKFRSERFEYFDELGQRWLQCQLGQPMSNVFHEHMQQQLDDEKAKRLGLRVECAA